MKPSCHSFLVRLRNACAIPLSLLLAAPAFGAGTPLISVDASALPTGALTSWTNSGTLGGAFSNDTTTVNVDNTGGRNSVTFTGGNWMKLVDPANSNATIPAPASITGNNPYSVVAFLYNPAIALEEAYLTWAQRGTSPRCAQFNYGTSVDFGAVTHWAGPDMGFIGVPAAATWHAIAVTFDGATERIYVNGVLNNSEGKTLNLWAGQPVFLGTSYGNADGSGKGIPFSGSIASLKVYGEALTAADVKTLSGAAFITGQVTSGGNPVSGATVYYKLSANASVGPLGTVITDGSGNYTIGVQQNTGPYYLAAGKAGYLTSGDSAGQSVGTSDVTGVNISLTQLPSITGNVFDASGSLYNAAVSISTNPDGSAPSQTVYTDTSGNYLAYVNQNATYYLIAKKSAHADSSVLTVPVTTSNVTAQNFSLTKNAAVKLVDLDARDLAVGSQTAAVTWPNTGTLGGSFTANAGYTVLDATNAAGRQAVSFTGSLKFTSSWLTSAAVWPSAIAGPDVQYTTVGWIYAPATTGCYLSWANGTGASRGTIGYNSSWMNCRYSNAAAWGFCDHLLSTWVGWTGTNTDSAASCPAFGSWHMIAYTYDGKTEKLYADVAGSMSKLSTPAAEGILRTFHPLANNMIVGSNNNNGDYFTGYIHKVQVFDQALSQTDITALWTTGNATNFTIAGNVSVSGGGALAGATVTVYSDAACTTALISANTDGSGNYVTANLPQNTTYYLKASKTGHVTSGALTVALGAANATGQNFTLSVIPAATVSGQVTESGTGTPLAGAKVYVSATANASASPAQVVTADGSGNYSTSLTGGTWYLCASHETHKTSADLTVVNTDGTAQSGKSFELVADTANNIPQKQSLLFSVLSDSLPTTQGADTGNWTIYQPLGGSLTKLGLPTIDMVGGKAFAGLTSDTTKGFRYMNLPQGNSLALNGATITTVIKPVRVATASAYQCVVSVLLGQLELCVNRNTGRITLGRKNIDAPTIDTGYSIPDGQLSIVSYVVQPTGEIKLYVNGIQQFSSTATADMTSITAQTWYATDISVGKGWNGDGWSSFNGSIADTFVYKTALSSADRIALETSLGAKFGVPMPMTITASAGANGTINPSGAVTVASGGSQAFTITPASGYLLDTLTVDGVPQSLALSYTFSNVTTNHTISATFKVDPNPTQRAHLMFDETSGTVASDSSGHLNAATLVADAAWSTGLLGNAVSLDGSDAHLTMPAGLMSGIDDFTIAAWVNLSANNTWNRVFDFGNSTAVNMFLTPRGDSNVVRFAINAGAGEQQINGTAALPTGSWQHVMVTLSGTTGTLYVNGVQVGQNTSMTLKPSSLGSTTLNYLGKSQWPDPYFNGRIDDFRIYNRALSAAEIGSELGVYSLSASAGSNGSISPAGVTAVPQGASQGFTFTPAGGYVIADVLVDGVSNPGAVAAGSYTFSNVTANHTISVSFLTPYELWLAQNTLTASDANFLKFAFGIAAGASPGAVAWTVGPPPTVTAGYPMASLFGTTGTTADFRAVFSRRSTWAADGLTYTVQFSADLVHWADSTDIHALVIDGTTITANGVDVVYAPYPPFIEVGGEAVKPTYFRVMVNTTPSGEQTP